jgi:hypothetical protein
MNQAEINPEMNLDQLLAGMAEDVPPMPADFHDKWMNAVRAEAKQTNQEKPAEKTEAPAVTPISQWPRILSIAAVFVFLIGGTFIYRSSRKSSLPESGAVTAAPVTQTVEAGEAVMPGTAMEKAADSAAEAGPRMDTDGETGFAAANSAAQGPMMNMAEEIPASKTSGKAAETNSAAEAPSAGMAMSSAGEEAYQAVASEEAEEAEPVVNEAAEAPAAAVTTTEAPATEAPVPATQARTGIGGFFADMGDFLLTVWPYLLAVLVLLAVAAVAVKSRKK